ncbi:MAG: Gfo/Idh/MocA family oxidoreductase [Pseudomonadota bacterium]|nr:Gfo/Idh/MocA family oxidoreductase [Pseudomonadota bacterium]
MKTFALIGAAGYIAPRHMRAIKDTGNVLVAALDANDTVGILDSYFPDARFFTEFERFDRYIDLQQRAGKSVDYVSVMSPNYLHDSHIRFALRAGAHAICEKPLVVNPWNAESLKVVEAESGKRVHTILQLRLHPSIVALRDKVAAAIKADAGVRFTVDLSYITSRGSWYFQSWKGDEKKSGGIAANIGIHFYDMLLWVFGAVSDNRVTHRAEDSASGLLTFANADVRWFLSINAEHLPAEVSARGQRTYRSITLNGEEIEFSDGFTELHTDSYRHILDQGGFGLDDALPSIELVHAIRSQDPVGMAGDHHPLATRAVQK